MNVKQAYKHQNTKVTFKENEEEALYCLKDGDPYYLAVDITIVRDGVLYSRYFRSFDKEVNALRYQNFIKKFLEDPSYRESFLVDSYPKWEGIIRYTSDKEGVKINKKCENAIHRLMKNKNPKFKDFLELKTFGMDGFSRMSKEHLSPMIAPEEIARIKGEFEDDKLVLEAMRWKARGLSSDYAIRKVKTNLEITKNYR